MLLVCSHHKLGQLSPLPFPREEKVRKCKNRKSEEWMRAEVKLTAQYIQEQSMQPTMQSRFLEITSITILQTAEIRHHRRKCLSLRREKGIKKVKHLTLSRRSVFFFLRCCSQFHCRRNSTLQTMNLMKTPEHCDAVKTSSVKAKRSLKAEMGQIHCVVEQEEASLFQNFAFNMSMNSSAR